MFGMCDRGRMGELSEVDLEGSSELGNSDSEPAPQPQYPPAIPKSIINWNDDFPA